MTGSQAGQSAHEMARRAREKAGRLQRSAAAWEAGAVGERATAQVLAGLDPAVWTTLHDVRWPGRQRANIDHVVVGPPGVFVIDSKNWSGAVQVTDGVLRQNGRSRETAVVGVAEAGIALLQIVPDVPVHPVLCLVREQSVSGWVRDVMLCSTANLDLMVRTRPHVLAPADVRRASAAIQAGLSRPPVGESPRRSSRPRRQPTKRARSSWARPLVGLLLMGLLFATLQTGAFATATAWLGDRFAGVILQEGPVSEPTTKPRPDRPRDGRAGDRRQ